MKVSDLVYNPQRPETYLRSLQKLLTDCCDRFDLPNLVLPPVPNKRMIQAVFGTGKGRVYSESVAAALEIISLFLEGQPGIALSALVQSGKAEVQAMVAILFPPILHAVKSQFVIPIAMTPGTDGLVSQFRQRFDDIYALFKSVTIAGESVHCYHEEASHLVKNHVGLLDGQSHTFARPLLVTPIRFKYTNYLRDLATMCQNTGARLFLLQDECDYGSGEKTVLDKTFATFAKPETVLKSTMYDLYNRKDGTFQLLRTSATNFDWKPKIVKIHPGKGYVGLDVDPADPTCRFTDKHVETPTVVSLTELCQKLGISPDLFDVNFRNDSRESIDQCFAGISRIVRHLLFEEIPFDSKGMVLRCVNDNSVTGELAVRLALADPRLCVIKHFQSDSDRLGPVAENIEKQVALHCERHPGSTPENTKYVALVTAACRMGENLPPDCNIMASLTLNAGSPISTILQDVGRVFGYKRGAYILTTDVAAHKIRNYGGLEYKGRLHANAVRDQSFASLRFCRSRQEIGPDCVQDKVVDSLLDKLTVVVKREGKFGRKTAYHKMFYPFMPRLNALATEAGVELEQFDDDTPLYLTKRTKRVGNEDKKGGKKNDKDVIVRVDQDTELATSFEWQLKVPAIGKVRAKGGLSRKLAA